MAREIEAGNAIMSAVRALYVWPECVRRAALRAFSSRLASPRIEPVRLYVQPRLDLQESPEACDEQIWGEWLQHDGITVCIERVGNT